MSPEETNNQAAEEIQEKTPEELGNMPVDLQTVIAVVNKSAEQVESRLADRLDAVVQSVNANLEATNKTIAAIQEQAKIIVSQAPQLIQEQIQGQLEKNLQGIIEQISSQFEGKVRAMAQEAGLGGNGAGGGALSIGNLMQHAPQLVEIINAFRAPTTEQAMMGQMSTIFKWHKLLSSLEKGGSSIDDLSNSIQETLTPSEE